MCCRIGQSFNYLTCHVFGKTFAERSVAKDPAEETTPLSFGKKQHLVFKQCAETLAELGIGEGLDNIGVGKFGQGVLLSFEMGCMLSLEDLDHEGLLADLDAIESG